MSRRDRRKFKWTATEDESGRFIVWADTGTGDTEMDADSAFQVYLPSQPIARDRAIAVIERALNRARVPRPRPSFRQRVEGLARDVERDERGKITLFVVRQRLRVIVGKPR